MSGLIDLNDHENKIKEIEIQREALRKARESTLVNIPKLPKISKGETNVRFLKRGSGNDSDYLDKPYGLELSHIQFDICGRKEIKTLCYYLGKDNTAEDLRDCLCKLLGTPTQQDLDSVKVEMI